MKKARRDNRRECLVQKRGREKKNEKKRDEMQFFLFHENQTETGKWHPP